MTEPTEPTKLYRLVDRGLDGKLAELVGARRTYEYPYAAIAREVSALSGIEVSDETVRRWFPEAAESAA